MSETSHRNTGNAINNMLWTETLRPQKLEHVILLPRIQQELEKGLVDNILFFSSPGTGKTTLTRIMSQGHETLTINASEERGIDVIRDKVIGFASQSSLFGGKELIKVVVLEECDNMTLDAWNALRATMEKFHRTVRFIANCNYIDKVPEPIQSRFNCIPVSPINHDEEVFLFSGYRNRIGLILKANGILIPDMNVLDEFIKADFPDLRSLVKKCQQLFNRGVKELTMENVRVTLDDGGLFALLLDPNSQPWDNYTKLAGEWKNKADDGILLIANKFPEYLRMAAPQQINKLPNIIVTCADYIDKAVRSTDKLITFLALVFTIQQILRS